jgi:DNA-binding transcriptional ArsR family regulator
MPAAVSPSDDVFRALADPTRRAILELLRDSALSASELSEPFDISQPGMSQHLRVLRDAGLVRVAVVGRQRYYALDPRPLRQIERWIHRYRRFWERKLDHLGEFLDRTE